MISLKIQENTLNLILISIIFLGSFFFENSIISFKLIYVLQILIIFYFLIKYSKIKIDKKIIFLNFIVLTIVFFKFDKSYVYLILICFLNTFFFLNKIKNINLNHQIILQIFFTIIMLLFFKTSTSLNNINIELFLFEEIKKNYIHHQTCIFNNGIENCEFNIKRLRYRFLNLHSNLTAIFCLIITYILLKDLNKKSFIFLFSLFGILFLYLTLSKSGLIFFLTILVLTLINLNTKFLLLCFFVFNLFLGIVSQNVSSSTTDFWDKDPTVGQEVYQKEFCPKIKQIPIIGFFNECDKEDNSKNDFIKKLKISPHNLIFNVMGYSTFYKIHSYGMVVESISNNLQYYLFPNPLYRLQKNQIINKNDITSKLSAHGLFFLVLLKYGLILGTVFFINLYLFLKKINEKKLFIAFMFSSTFLSLDIFLLFPFFLLSLLIKSGYK